MHHIQKHILEILTHNKNARFARLRPPRTDSNLFSYHLKILVKQKLVEKTSEGYMLTSKGLAFVDRVSMANFEPRLQPKIITMIVVFNKNNEVLLQRRKKQPFIDSWTLPSGKLHLDDPSILAAARRELTEKTGFTSSSLKPADDYYIKVNRQKEIISSVLAHIFATRFSSAPTLSGDLQWCALKTLHTQSLAPAVGQIVTDIYSGKKGEFKELQINYTG